MTGRDVTLLNIQGKRNLGIYQWFPSKYLVGHRNPINLKWIENKNGKFFICVLYFKSIQIRLGYDV